MERTQRVFDLVVAAVPCNRFRRVCWSDGLRAI